jgi:hypothetical protein
MALVSILLAVTAFVCTVIGFLTTPIPVLGTLFSFGAAGVALGGALLGGKAVTAAKKGLLPTDAARIAVVLNIVALVPALLVAFTCGVCNAIVSTGNVDLQRNLNFQLGPNRWGEAGSAALPPPDRAPPTSGGPAPGQPQSLPVPPSEPAPSQSPSQMPPPPLPAGPGR